MGSRLDETVSRIDFFSGGPSVYSLNFSVATFMATSVFTRGHTDLQVSISKCMAFPF